MAHTGRDFFRAFYRLSYLRIRASGCRLSVWHCVVSQPWYSYAVARWILNDFRRAATLSPKTAPKLRIVEAGGGAGTHARHILDYLRLQAPDVYAEASYSDVELSAAMGQRAVETVEQAGHRNFAVISGDITDTTAGWTAAADVGGEELCYVVLMEVLDNLPHDKVQISYPTSRKESDAITVHQIVVAVDEKTQTFVERAEPLSDPLLSRALEVDHAYQLREADDPVAQAALHPDYTPGRASGEGVLGNLLVRSFACSFSQLHLDTCVCLHFVICVVFFLRLLLSPCGNLPNRNSAADIQLDANMAVILGGNCSAARSGFYARAPRTGWHAHTGYQPHNASYQPAHSSCWSH